MGKTALVTGGTHDEVVGMGTLALNIKEIVPNLADELIIFHDGISKKDQEIINNIFPTRFCKYDFPISFLDKRRNSAIRYFSPMVFCKYECFRLLEEYDRIIWSDYDVVILKDLTELMENDAGLQIVEEREPLKTRFQDMGQCVEKEYDIERHGVSTPIFVLTRDVGDYRMFYHWCIENTRKYIPYIQLPEQCIFSMLVQRFGIEYVSLPDAKYALHPRYYEEDALIIHAYGRPKFWEGLSDENWNRYYQQWLALGGSPYKLSLKKRINKLLAEGKNKMAAKK